MHHAFLLYWNEHVKVMIMLSMHMQIASVSDSRGLETCHIPNLSSGRW
jgi:hypothetical protein